MTKNPVRNLVDSPLLDSCESFVVDTHLSFSYFRFAKVAPFMLQMVTLENESLVKHVKKPTLECKYPALPD